MHENVQKDYKSRAGLMSRFLPVLAGFFMSLSIASSSHAGSYDDFFKAVKMDNPQVVESLLRRGLDPNLIEPERSDTGLILALREDSMAVFRMLLEAPDIKLEMRTTNGDTALMIAAFKSNVPAVKALLVKGAEVNQTGWTALHYAAAVGSNEIVQLLLDRSAYIDAEAPNRTTPLMMAARGGHIYTVKLLHDSGADATLKNALGMTAVDFARQNDHDDIAEGLAYRIRKQEQKESEAVSQPPVAAKPTQPRMSMIQPEDDLPICQAVIRSDESPSVFFQASERSEALLEAFPDDPD